MATQLSSHKRKLTNHCNKLETIISRFKSEKLESWPEDIRTPGYEKEYGKRIKEALGAIEACSSKVEQLWEEYACALDRIENVPKVETDDYDAYANKAEGTLNLALDYTVILRGRLRACTTADQDRFSPPRVDEMKASGVVGTQPVALPTLPIPVFTGNMWDWDNFWVLFEANVHTQPIPTLYKFNHLLNALKGKALNAIRQFQITEENYDKAIQFLQTKYGDKQALVHKLIERLENVTSHSLALKDQRVLLEQLQAIVSQLRGKGEQVDNQWLMKQVLTKFPERYQRRVLERKYSMEESFQMDTLLLCLDQVISTEEKIALHTSKTGGYAPESTKKDRVPKVGFQRGNFACMYCKGGHKASACTKYGTPQERAKYLREHKLCFICASSQHVTSECGGRVCFICQGKHHTSCCFKQAQASTSSAFKKGKSPPSRNTKENRTYTSQPNPKSVTTTQLSRGTETPPTRKGDQESSMSQLHCNTTWERRETFLPIGELMVMNKATRKLKKVAVLMDSGAECSFIDSKLAQELNLPTLGTTTLRVRTFGSDEVQECMSRKVPLEIWDENGDSFMLELLTHDILTSSLKTPPIAKEDREFLESLPVPINLMKKQNLAQPRVLLGCDQMWPLIRQDQANIRLPSGLYLLPTRIGHLLTGQLHSAHQMTQVLKESDMLQEWNKCWSLEASVNMVSGDDFTEDQDEKALWERYWALERDGVEEFTSSEKDIKARIDEGVWKNFIDTIEKKEDGYYVRLPWKEISAPLPDNRAIAVKRLISVWNSLQKDKSLLERYNDIFQEQKRLEIIEEVEDERQPVEGKIHYLPHQAVLTPQKTTTKVRIVFDASAHFKNSPSLNDALHRGPVILPKLYGLLLRFRIGRIALISDVEKAFLQVRLHHIDRDATRCLWLRDHTSPPNPGNLQVYRFTRVTFGILSSPFLLAATTHYHLDQYPNDKKLVTEIKENLYVDNLILTVDSMKEAGRVYRRTKAIFNELHMNLREFTSNNKQLMETIERADRSTENNPKVLGIRWHVSEDQLMIGCEDGGNEKVTKRTVASTIASIYDPMGWMLPLVHKAKIFLQSLWNKEVSWDTPLQEQEKVDWESIVREMRGFHKSLPRFLADRGATIQLITCADASTNAFAACTYAHTPKGTNLLMAKGKLPNLKSKTTVPKLELNALTLAMRLTQSVVAQIESLVSVDNILILTDSEIALSWVTGELRHDAGPFIKNRVAENHKIREHLRARGYDVEWGYIPSQQNPADCATRGLDKSQLSNHFWWTGPEFLRTPREKWREGFRSVDMNRNTEKRNLDGDHEDTALMKEVFAQTTAEYRDIFHTIKFSEFPIVLRVVAYVLRFIRRLATKRNRKGERTISIPILSRVNSNDGEDITIPSGNEMDIACMIVTKQHQMSHITPTILKALQHLKIYQDAYGVLRCRGRLGKSALDESAKYPMLVLQKSWLAQLIIRDCHTKFHLGVSHTMAKVREKYWIPKLRAEVTRTIRRCAVCQRYNSLPYKYPEQEDLPTRRVNKSRPFSHVGLDYFGPLSVRSENNTGKCYGAIITCLVTRLIHLDLVSDNSTIAFLQMLRRFFARRGAPLTITSDNAPSFALGEIILSECLQRMKNDPMIATELSTRHINWIYITPYAPWQGGVYERLIQSIKLAMHKALGKSTPSYEELHTVIIEIEGILNTRPLLYVESDSAVDRVLRPIDFLQNEFEITPVLNIETEAREDGDYLSPAERLTFHTKLQVIKALESSCKLTEQFWHTWQAEYLTSLREKHRLEVGHKRGSTITPKKGQVVLISEALQPRHTWKMGRISDLITNKEGVTREAVILLPSRRKIRRPLNLLVPLELDEDFEVSEEHQATKSARSDDGVTKSKDLPGADQPTSRQNSRYNLRSRKGITYGENMTTNLAAKSALFVAVISALVIIGSGSTVIQELYHKQEGKRIRCIEGGVELTSTDQGSYEICAENYCEHISSPRTTEEVRFPAHIILHEHDVQWKFRENGTLKTIETTCSKAPFCDYIDCMLCSALLFNPECWPVGAIVATALLLYLLLTGCYVFLYVPLVLGKPVRVLANIVRFLLRWTGGLIWQVLQSTRRRRARDLVEVLAIVVTIFFLASAVYACQQIDVFSHRSTICENTSGTGTCKIQVSEILKINPFKREACLRLRRNSTTLYEVRVLWKSLNLFCEQETDFFTRDTEYKVVSSKRCAHKGSCTSGKCADINGSTLVQELAIGNSYPGTTYCVTSCGGLGCDCFWPGSACLFYRVYAVPTSDRIYEVFHCTQWKEAAKLEITKFGYRTNKRDRRVVEMRPNIPVTEQPFTFTLSSITVPPTPLLNTPFITDGNRTSLWEPSLTPTLLCETPEAALNLSCERREDCTCYPAETQVNCQCREINIDAWCENLQHRLPVITSSVSFRQDPTKGVRATIAARTTSEIILTVQDEIETAIMVDEAICTISDAPLTGCYKCAKGAEANVTCKSSKPTQAEILCGDLSFTVQCDEHGISSLIRFAFAEARVGLTCTLSCGKVTTTFQLEGVLKFTQSVHTLMSAWLKGDGEQLSEFQWPDIAHIVSVFGQWYKTLALASTTALLMLAFTYIFLATFGGKILSLTFRFFLRLFRMAFRACCSLPLYFIKRTTASHGKTL